MLDESILTITLHQDLFEKSRGNTLKFNLFLLTFQIYSDGVNYGDVVLHDKNTLRMTSLSSKQMLDLTLDNVALCVVPANNRNEMEMHFHEIDDGNRANDDNLVQITLHFPPGDVPEDEEEQDDFLTPAEEIRQSMMDTGTFNLFCFWFIFGSFFVYNPISTLH